MTVIDNGIFNLVINGNIAVMDFNPSGTRYPQDLVTSSFERERRYLLKLIAYPWAPELLEINPHTRQIAFKWYGNTCETTLPANWEEQLTAVVQDLHNEQIHKPSFYTKFFYVDNIGQIHAYAFYSASDFSEQPIDMAFYRPILNPQRSALVDELEQDGKLDMGILVRHAFTDYIKWPNDSLATIYQKIYQPQ